jgi:hypothetical protein
VSEDPVRWRRPTRGEWRTFALYAGCSAVYIAIGLVFVDFLLAFVTAAVYLFVTAWLIPAAIRRLR